jgi:DNA-binding HxlR family transcriptional regulator
MPKVLGHDSTCSIARAAEILGDTWNLLILREALLEGSTRFEDFRRSLGVAPNILAKRLALLVEVGVMSRRDYRVAGSRARQEYLLTESGRSLSLVVAALATWGRTYRPHPQGTSPQFFLPGADSPAQLAFIDAQGAKLPPEQLIGRPEKEGSHVVGGP